MKNPVQLLNDPVIAKQVYEKYPVSKAERKCDNEKRTMDNLRLNMAKKIYEAQKEKKEYGQ